MADEKADVDPRVAVVAEALGCYEFHASVCGDRKVLNLTVNEAEQVIRATLEAAGWVITKAEPEMAEKLREAAKWLDTVDDLVQMLQVTVTATGQSYPLVDAIGEGPEIQDDLLAIADHLEVGRAR